MIEIIDCSKKHHKDLYLIHCAEMPEFDKMTESCFFDEFNQKTRKYFVATENKKPIGYVGIFDSLDDYNIIGIAVNKNFHRKGVGSLLIKKIVEEAKKNKVATISLEVDEKNEKAINFYKKMGFVVTNIRKKYYKDNDALIMWLYL